MPSPQPTPPAPGMDAQDLYQLNRVLQHRLRNHSADMKMTLSRIEAELRQQGSRLADHCLLMRQALQSLQDLTSRMDLVFAEVPEPENLSLFALVRTLRSHFTSRFPFTSFSMEGEELDLNLPAGNLALIALQELADNAGEAADDFVECAWELDRANSTLLLIVVNDGGPVAPSIPCDAPRPFRTTRGRHDGLGLAIVLRLALIAGGKFTLEGVHSHVRATLALPVTLS